MKTVVIIDDDMDMRDGLRAWLSFQYRILLFSDAGSFLNDLTAMAECDCLLLDLRMPGMNGADLQRELNDREFSEPIVFMSGDAQKADIISAWRSGAFDFVLKPFSPNEISETLQKVFAAKEFNSLTDKPAELPITRREAQVLLLLGDGFHQQEIADRLGLSLRTVKMYRALLKNKLNLNNLVDVAKFCNQFREIIQKRADC